MVKKNKKTRSIGYLHNGNKVNHLSITLSKTSAYVKSYDGQTKWNYFLIEDDDLFEKYNTISSLIKNFWKPK